MYWKDTPAVEARELEYLREALPVQDRIMLNDAQLKGLIARRHAVSRMLPWSARIPMDVYLPFVLFPRVNNEDLDIAADQKLWPTLLPCVQRGADMERAVMAVNRWCFEQATYQSTDARTANALTVMRRGFGRCGEESVLLVTALRACGIPARQIYVPLWSHCDDNHAWVEAWVDGGWRYLGACEPELSLDSGWFTAAASKAMLVHTRAYGVLPEGERAEARVGGAYVLNRTAAYARTRLLTVRVVENGAPKPGVRVDFEVANMAAYRPICGKVTGADGTADLLTGLGTLHIWASDGARAAECVADVSREDAVELDLAAATLASGTVEYRQRPPRESRIQPADFPAEAVAAHAAWLERTEAERQARFALPGGTDPLLCAARGNRGVIERFLSDGRFEAEDKRALLESLREKDLADATEDVLTDAMFRALPCRDRYPREVWIESVLCPRVKDEMLYPVRRWMTKKLPRFDRAEAVWEFLCGRLEPCEMEPATLTPNLRSALEYGRCSDAVRDVLFVAVCRANGLAARLDPVTGEKEVWRDGAYRALLPSRAPDARLILRNGAGRALTGGVHFTVSVLEGGAYRVLALDGAVVEDALTVPVFPGRYRVMTAARQIDGSLEGFVRRLEIGAGETVEAALTLPEDRTADRLLRAALPPLRASEGGAEAVLPDALAGRPGIVALIAPGQEPTEHFLNELLEARPAIEARGIAVRLLVQGAEVPDNAKLRRVLEALGDVRCLTAPDAAALRAWRERMNAGELRLPLAVAIGRSGAGLFAFVNYNVGSVLSLIGIIDAE